MKDAGHYRKIIEDDYLEKIIGFAYNKTGSTYEAEDLAQEIILELYSSLERSQNVKNFPAWVWSIARYTYYHWHDKWKGQALNEIRGPLISTLSTDDPVIESDEINRLRREISFLSQNLRKIIILYYFEEKSCGEIADELDIPVGTVKWYLFDARKKLKRGMRGMRSPSNRSFKPGHLSVGIQGKPGRDKEPFSLVNERILPQNILISVWEKGKSIGKLSEELGIARPYLEDEVQMLIEGELMHKNSSGLLQTNFIIIDCEQSVKLFDIILDYEEQCAEQLLSFMRENKDKILDLKFSKTALEWDRLLWIFISICYLHVQSTFNKREKPEEYFSWKKIPVRSNGGKWVALGRIISEDKEELYGSKKAVKKDKSTCNGFVKSSGEWGGKGWIGTYWSGITPRAYSEIKDKDVILLRKIAEDRLKLKELNEEQKERLSIGIEKGYIQKREVGYEPIFPIFTIDELNRLEEIWDEAYPVLEPVLSNVYDELHNELEEYIPDHLHHEITMSVNSEMSRFIGLTLNRGIEKSMLNVPEQNTAKYLTLYIW